MASRDMNYASAVDHITDHMQSLMREMANFVAMYETIDEKLIAREIALESKIISSEQLLLSQLNYVKNAFNDFHSIMTEAGAARWRIAAENALRDGTQHLHNLQETTSEISQTLRDGSEQFGIVANQTVKGLTDAASTFHADRFKEAASIGCVQIKEFSVSQIKRITKLVSYFHLKNVFLSLGLTLFVIFLTGLYINDEWPWESHQQVAKEREAGKTLLAAWSYLSPQEQQDIISSGKKARG